MSESARAHGAPGPPHAECWTYAIMDLSLKKLIGRLNPVCHAALEAAAGACVTRGGSEIAIEDLLLQILEGVETDFALLLKVREIRVEALRAALQHDLERLPRGQEARPVFSSSLIRLLEQAWLYASVELGESRIRSGAIAVALRVNSQWYGMRSHADLITRLPTDLSADADQKLLARSAEAVPAGESAPAAAPDAGGAGMFDRFTHDFTARAEAGGIDPVLCRDDEIRQLVDILARRQKNNPILVGEAGVGKTAVVEGLARRIVAGEVPPVLAGARVLELDLGALQAGASVRGEFEKRLNGLLQELRDQAGVTVLFIDEAHTLIGAGGDAGSGDAANLLKPALARGELRAVAATTWSEYRKYFEKDAALARRFQLVKLPEPTPEQATTILRGLRTSYEQAHQVYVRDDALEAAATLSARYITGRQLPDKAVDLLDTACARVNLAQHATPPTLERVERRIEELTVERAALARDVEHAVAGDGGRLNLIDDEIATLRQESVELRSAWETQREAVQTLIGLRGAGGDDESTDPASVADFRARIGSERERLESMMEGRNLVPHEVSPDVVSQVVSDWTGIPLGRLVHDEADVLLTLQDRLHERVLGQTEALGRISERIRTAKAGLTDPQSPLGVFLLAGPSGVGKTETAQAVAELLFGGTQALVTINMSEFQERHTVSRLIGSPPGYVGYGEGGVLTEAVRQRPYSVVLFDEVEKAHQEVLSIFYQLFDKGVVADGEGREIDFRNTVIFLTSNLGAEEIAAGCERDPQTGLDDLVDLLHDTLTAHFRSPLLARMEAIPYRTIPREVLAGIVDLKLTRVADRLRTQQGLELEIGDGLAEFILDRCTVAEAGARNVEAVINRQVLPEMARDLLGRLGDDAGPSRCKVEVSDGRVMAAVTD